MTYCARLKIMSTQEAESESHFDVTKSECYEQWIVTGIITQNDVMTSGHPFVIVLY